MARRISDGPFSFGHTRKMEEAKVMPTTRSECGYVRKRKNCRQFLATKFGQMKKKDYFCTENVSNSRTANR